VTFVRNLFADLVAKRLWPVAAVLVLALVAGPVVLVKTSAEEPVATPAAAPPSDSASAVAVTPVAEQARGGRPPMGRNPFKQPTPPGAVPAKGDPQGQVLDKYNDTMDRIGDAAEDWAKGGAGTGGSVPVGDDAWGDVPGLDDVDVIPVGGGTGSGTPATAKTDARASWHVDLRFGQDGKLASRSDVPRLSPLPSVADPFFVFLGVLADGKTALFLVSSDAEATGDGKCLPSPQSCERVEMQAGDTEFFDVTAPDGSVKQYQLDLVRVARRTQASTAVAAAARSRESGDGREVLRTAVDTGQVQVADLAYSRELGLVLPSGETAGEDEEDAALFGGFRVDLQFGAAGALVKRYNLARLTPLPSVEKPSFVYLGVLDDGKTALFLNPTEAAVSGDAECLPSPDECQRVQLKAGDKAALASPTIDGQTEEYELSVDAISKVEVSSQAEAAASLKRESPAGRQILRRLITEVGSLVGDLSYSNDSGALEPVEPAAGK
jgi:hypothetical protein